MNDPQRFDRETGRYNGWANYATWCVNAWLTSEEGVYHYWRERAAYLARDGKEEGRDAFKIERDLADDLKSEIFDEALERLPTKPWKGYQTGCYNGMLSDLLCNALDSVDWQEIAAAFLED